MRCRSRTTSCLSAAAHRSRSCRRRFSPVFPSWARCPRRRAWRSIWPRTSASRSLASSAATVSTSTRTQNESRDVQGSEFDPSGSGFRVRLAVEPEPRNPAPRTQQVRTLNPELLNPEPGMFGIGQQKPHHYLEMARVAWENRDQLPFAWRILNDGVCDGCALGTSGLSDWTIDGVHLCMVRLELLRLNTAPPLAPARPAHRDDLRSLTTAQLRALG